VNALAYIKIHIGRTSEDAYKELPEDPCIELRQAHAQVRPENTAHMQMTTSTPDSSLTSAGESHLYQTLTQVHSVNKP